MPKHIYIPLAEAGMVAYFQYIKEKLEKSGMKKVDHTPPIDAILLQGSVLLMNGENPIVLFLGMVEFGMIMERCGHDIEARYNELLAEFGVDAEMKKLSEEE